VENGGKNDKLGKEIDMVLIVGGIGLLINIIGMCLFHNHTHHHHSESEQLITNEDDLDLEAGDKEVEDAITREIINHNQAALFLHIMGDFLGSVVVIVTGLVIKYIDWKWKYYLDPIASLLVIMVIIGSSLKLFKYCINILSLLGAANNVSPSLTNVVVIASFHLKLHSRFSEMNSTDELLKIVKRILHRYQIHSSCIQLEWCSECVDPICHDSCGQYQCCN